MKTCKYCGAPMADENRFCAECGQEFPQGNVCPHCGASVNEGDNFCQHCGKKPTDALIENNETVHEEERENSFKKYLPYILGAFIGLAIAYCKSHDSKGSDDSQSQTVAVDSTSTGVEASVSAKEAITKRLEEIFDNVAKGKTNDYEERYFSSDFNRIYNEVADIDKRILEEGDIGYWDFCFWENSQENPKMDVFVNDVYDVKDKEAMAKIAFKFTYFNGISHTDNEDIRVVLENDKWVLDDLHGYKKQMKAYIEEFKDYQPSTDVNTTSDNSKYFGRWTSYIESGGQRVKVYTAIINSDMTARWILYMPNGSVNSDMSFRQCVFKDGMAYFTDNGDTTIKMTPRFRLGANGLQTADGIDLIKE